MGTLVSLLLLAGVLAFAVVRPRGLPEAVATVPAALVAVVAGSILLPVSNLTNLLAMSAGGLTFVQFAGLMAAPWVAVVAVEYAILHRFFADDLHRTHAATEPERVPAPRYALVVLAATLAGFVVAGPLAVHPAWVAALGALARHRGAGGRAWRFRAADRPPGAA